MHTKKLYQRGGNIILLKVLHLIDGRETFGITQTKLKVKLITIPVDISHHIL